MKRIMLRLLDLLTMLSLILLIGVSALWPWSYPATPVNTSGKTGQMGMASCYVEGNFPAELQAFRSTSPIVGPELGPMAFADPNNAVLLAWPSAFANRSRSYNAYGFAYIQWPVSGTIQGQGFGPNGNAAELGLTAPCGRRFGRLPSRWRFCPATPRFSPLFVAGVIAAATQKHASNAATTSAPPPTAAPNAA